MKQSAFLFLVLSAIGIIFQSCSNCRKDSPSGFISENVRFASGQYKLQTDLIEKSGHILDPKTFIDGKIRYVSREEWTSGFFSGSLWQLYALTDDPRWQKLAWKYTEPLDSAKYLTSHHDVGFIIESSFGNGIRLGGYSEWKNVIVEAAKSLSTRFRPVAGVIQSWNTDRGWQSKRGWECPVIIDNMMNLQLLFDATKYSGDSTFYRIAVSHADKTMENHFRQDYSCWHVVDYSLSDGSVRSKGTAQGYSDDSAWSRGQAWAIYGFTVCYRETKNPKYLTVAEKAFDFVANHPNFPEDGIPWWDLDAPPAPGVLRDVSAAAIMASALYELSSYSRAEYYKGWADKIMKSLAGPDYRAVSGANGNFILMHSVGSIPHNSEVDVPLNYADYYFLEALNRKKNLEQKGTLN